MSGSKINPLRGHQYQRASFVAAPGGNYMVLRKASTSERYAKRSSDHSPLGGFHPRGKNEGAPSSTDRESKNAKDLADQFRQWQKLRAKVSKAELGAAQATRLPSETKVKGNGRKPPKPTRFHPFAWPDPPSSAACWHQPGSDLHRLQSPRHQPDQPQYMLRRPVRKRDGKHPPFLIAGVLTAWGTVFVVQKYAIGERNDHLAKAGGLNPAQRSVQQPK